jgi:hypothetical protein
VLNEGATFYFSLPAPDKGEIGMPAPGALAERRLPTGEDT